MCLSRLFVSSIIVTCAVLAACSSSSSSDGKSGAAPTAKDLTLTPATVPINKAVVLDGNVTVGDVDGDLAALAGEITLPNGQVQPQQETDLTSLGNATTSPVPFTLSLSGLPLAGAYTFSFYAKDRAGNVSAKVATTITAQ
jgi:hypothetical protein